MKKKIENFRYKLLSKYKDEKYGTIYLVEFRPKDSTCAFWGEQYSNISLGYFKGEMLINSKDYSAISIKIIYQRNADNIASFVKKQYQSSWWEADKIGKIVPSSIVYNIEYTYKKNLVTNKYFVQTVNETSYENGYQIETNQNVQLYYQMDVNSISLKNVTKE